MSAPTNGLPSPLPSSLPAPLPAGSIEQVDLWLVRVPLRLPFEASHGTEDRREVVVVRVVDADGSVGYGECDALSHPTYTHEYARGALHLLRDEVVPALLAGREDAGLDRWHPMARAALGTARLDAVLRREGRSLAAALGAPAERTALARTAVLGRAGSIEQLLGWVQAALDGGAAAVKLKVGGLADLAVCAEVRAAFPTAMLAADANGSLAGHDAAALRAAGLDRIGLRYLEQPYPADDLPASAALRQGCDTPVCLDESIGSLGAARVARALGALDLVNVKPARLGGVAEAVAVATWAEAEGVAAFCGGMLELGVGRAAAAAVAARIGDAVPTDLGPSAAYVVEDLTEAIGLDAGGRLLVPAGPGIGVTPDLARLAAAAVERATLARPGPVGPECGTPA